jgi:hypothetical protein
VTLLNAAASNTFRFAGMEMPASGPVLPNIFEARLTDADTRQQVFCLSVDALAIPGRVTFVKIDVEGHEFEALKGMANLLEKHLPVLVVEGSGALIKQFLSSFGYHSQRYAGSPNTVFSPPGTAEDRDEKRTTCLCPL